VYFRCADCLTSTWTSVVRAGKIVPSIDCGGCGRDYTLEPSPDLGATVRSHYSQVLAFSKSNELDMASAYAVLLGIMSLEQAQVLTLVAQPDLDPDKQAPPTETEPPVERQAPVVPEPETVGTSEQPVLVSESETDDTTPEVEIEADPEDAPPKQAPGEPLTETDSVVAQEIDPGFQAAIKAGQMTHDQAMTRGDRKAFAARLVKRHRMSRGLALQVADNRISLGQALRRIKEAKEARAARPRQGSTSRRAGVTRAQVFFVGVVGLLAVAALVWHFWSNRLAVERSPVAATQASPVEQHSSGPTTSPGEPAPPDRQSVLQAATQVRRDAEDNVVEVRGPDPVSVLTSFCDAASVGPGREPIEITSTIPPSQNTRLGLFRDFASMESAWMIRIRKDAQTGRWVAGNGLHPVHVTLAPKLPPNATVIPVRR